ncbi:hypothetical protein JZ751_023315 [Albula glossodonta]|uniref:NACHT domain-containing protein n=1 Tax=Albula glossodonta TaxID=121402 RepID=A0A8T2NHD8_9TELE|nr:hypothetical protein JZ751_023315 [Albula glossodonta]
MEQVRTTWDLASTPLQRLSKLHRDAIAVYSLEKRGDSPFGGRCPREVVLNGQYVPLEVGEGEESDREPAGDSECLQDVIVAALSQDRDQPRAVRVVGPAGVGKTTAMQKLLADWAAGKRLPQFTFVFPLALGELGSRAAKLSLADLLCQQHPHLSTDSLPLVLQNPRALFFVLDGLDRFQNQEADTSHCSNPNLAVPLSALVSSLLWGTLLPGASVLVTSRPIDYLEPEAELECEHVEVRGLSDAGRKAYVGLFFTDQGESTTVLWNMEETMGFYDVIHLPAFCWTLCSVYRAALGAERGLPKTLTHVFADATATLIRLHAMGEAPARDLVLGLGKMAAHSLLHDAKPCDQKEMTTFGLEPFLSSPVLSAFLREDGKPGTDGHVFYFLSPTAAQFLLAVSYFLDGQEGEGVEDLLEEMDGCAELLELFLAGLCDPPQRELLEGAVGKFSSGRTQGFDTWLKETTQEAVPGYSKESHLRCFRLLHQRQDRALVTEAVGPSARLGLSYGGLSAHSAMALSYLAMCCVDLDQLNLLSQSHISEGAYAHLSAGLRGGTARELDLAYNSTMGDQGAERLCAGLAGTSLQILRLPSCNLTRACCGHLATALCSTQLHLLDLRGNDIEDQGLVQLSQALRSPKCQLQELNLPMCNLTAVSMESLSSSLRSGHSVLRSLNLTQNSVKDDGMRWLSAALKDPSCPLQSLILSDCELTEACCVGLADALTSGGGKLTELDLSVNELEDSGASHLCSAFKKPGCGLQKLRLERCELGEQTFQELAAVLRVEGSQLRELEVGLNKVGNTGVKHLLDALKDPHCKLELLDIEMVGLQDGCVPDMITAVKASGTLKNLVLKNNGLTDDVVPALVAMAQESHTLRNLNLQYNDFSEDVFEIMDACGKIRY